MDQLETIIEALEKEIRALTPGKILPVKDERARATAGLILRNYSEALLILRRIAGEKKNCQALQSQLTGAHNSQSDVFLNVSLQLFEIMRFLALDVKSLYVWCHQIELIFRECDVKVDLSDLHRLSLIRNTFLTHISEQQFFKNSVSTQMGLKFDGEFDDIQLLFHSERSFDVGHEKLDKLVEQVKEYIPEVGNEVNFYERIRLIYLNLNRIFDDRLKKEAENIIKTVGVASDPPAKIASALLTTLREYRQAILEPLLKPPRLVAR